MKKMLPIMGNWEVQARETTCAANHGGIPPTWIDDSLQPTPHAVKCEPRPVLLSRPHHKSQQKWLPQYPDGARLAPSDQIVVDEIEERDLTPGEVELLEFCLYHITLARSRPTDEKIRRALISRIYHNSQLAALLGQHVLAGVPAEKVLQPRHLKQLFPRMVGSRTFQRDLKRIRKLAKPNVKVIETTEDSTSAVKSSESHSNCEKQRAPENLPDEEFKTNKKSFVSTSTEEQYFDDMIAHLREVVPQLPEPKEARSIVLANEDGEWLLEDMIKWMRSHEGLIQSIKDDHHRKFGKQLLKVFKDNLGLTKDCKNKK